MPDLDYILEPLDTDAESIYQNFVEYVQGFYPDWNPSEPQLDIIIARFFAQQQAVIADMATRVQRAIYRYFGANLANIPPLPGSSAIATISFHVIDEAAHTLDYGTQLGLTDANGDLQIFTTLGDMNVPAGPLPEWPSIQAQAINSGAAGNNLSGTVQMLELTDWIDEAQVVGASSGGSDPEDDPTYIQRLTNNLSIPRRPMLSNDVVVLAMNIPGVWRAACIDNYHDLGGGNFSTDLEDSFAVSAIDVNGEVIPDATRDVLMTYLQGMVPQNFLITWVPPTYHTVAIDYEAQALQLSGVDGASVESDVDSNFGNFLSPANFGQIAGQSQARSWVQVRTLRYLELTTILENTNLIDYTKNLVFGIDGGAKDKNDKALSGVFPLTRPGAFNGTIDVL